MYDAITVPISSTGIRKYPSIDGQQFVVQYDTESSMDSSTNNTSAEEDNTEGDPDVTNDSLKNMESNKPLSPLIINGAHFNAIDYLVNTLYSTLDSLEFDKALVLQSKMAGEINNTSNEVLYTIDQLRTCLKDHISKYENLKKNVIPEIISNINKSAKTANQLTKYVKKMYPVEFSKSREKVLDRITDEDEDLYV